MASDSVESRLPPEDAPVRGAASRKERTHMATLFVRHPVSDYAKWREVYNSVAPLQKRSGVIAGAVYQADGDPNDVTVTHEFGSIAEAKAFAESAELREAMATAGVLGIPTVWFGNKA
jgi:hypothetical protein